MVGVLFLWVMISVPVISKIAIATLVVFAIIGIVLNLILPHEKKCECSCCECDCCENEK